MLTLTLDDIGSTADVESVLACWFDADFVPFEETLDLASERLDVLLGLDGVDAA